MTRAALAPLLAVASGVAGLLVPRASAAGRVLVFAFLGLSGAAALVAGIDALSAAAPRTSQVPLGLTIPGFLAAWFDAATRLIAGEGVL